MLRRLLVVWVLVGCGGSSPTTLAPKPPTSTPTHAWSAVPTAASAGGETCRASKPIEIGATSERFGITVGWGPKGGLVTWLDAGQQHRARALSPDGAAAGPEIGFQHPPEGSHDRLLPLDDGRFIVLGRLFDETSHRMNGSYVALVDGSGHLVGRFVPVPGFGRALPFAFDRKGNTLVVLGQEIEREDAEAVWMEVLVPPSGPLKVTARPVTLPSRDVPAPSNKMASPIRGDGPLGFVLVNGDTGRAEVVHDGQVTPLRAPLIDPRDDGVDTFSAAWDGNRIRLVYGRTRQTKGTLTTTSIAADGAIAPPIDEPREKATRPPFVDEVGLAFAMEIARGRIGELLGQPMSIEGIDPQARPFTIMRGIDQLVAWTGDRFAIGYLAKADTFRARVVLLDCK